MALHNILLQNRAVKLQVVNDNDVYKNFAPPDLPMPFGRLYDKTKVGTSYAEVMEECERLLAGPLLHCNEDICNRNSLTVGEKKTKLWDTYRARCCKASNVKQIVTANLDVPAMGLMKKCYYPAENSFSTEATRL